jgi:hypothetical protein
MRDLRIIVIESELAERGFEWQDRLFTQPPYQSPETVARKSACKRASLLAAHLGGASDPETVRACARWIEVCDRLGWQVEVDADTAARILRSRHDATGGVIE